MASWLLSRLWITVSPFFHNQLIFYHFIYSTLGKTFGWASAVDVNFAISVVKYFAGWADKITGQSIEVRSFPVCDLLSSIFILSFCAFLIRLTSENWYTLVMNPSES